jgi:hypothetical protein
MTDLNREAVRAACEGFARRGRTMDTPRTRAEARAAMRGTLDALDAAESRADKAEARVKVLREAIEPLALLAPSEISGGVNMGDPLSRWFTIAQLVRADDALNTTGGTDD